MARTPDHALGDELAAPWAERRHLAFKDLGNELSQVLEQVGVPVGQRQNLAEPGGGGFIETAQYWTNVAALITLLAIFIAGVFWYMRHLKKVQEKRKGTKAGVG